MDQVPGGGAGDDDSRPAVLAEPFSLDVIAWFLVGSDAFAALRSELLLAIKERVERSGASFASPPALQPARERR